MRAIVDELSAVYARRSIVAECSGDVSALLDAGRISQMVSNLVANALQHGSEATRVVVMVHGDRDTVNIDVHDAGPAIEPERLRTLFAPLTRLPASADRSRLGLGLYIAQQIARAHDGTISVTSTESAGTRFAVRLQRHKYR